MNLLWGRQLFNFISFILATLNFESKKKNCATGYLLMQYGALATEPDFRMHYFA